MATSCKKCRAQIIELDLSDQQKSEIMQMIEEGKPLAAVKKMMHDYSMDHSMAKGIAMHLNKYGKCHRCNFDNLAGQNVECPKCKSFNYNLQANHG